MAGGIRAGRITKKEAAKAASFWYFQLTAPAQPQSFRAAARVKKLMKGPRPRAQNSVPSPTIPPRAKAVTAQTESERILHQN